MAAGLRHLGGARSPRAAHRLALSYPWPGGAPGPDTLVGSTKGASMDATMMDVPLCVNHLLERAARLFPEVEVVSQMPDRRRVRHAYRQIRQRARALAAGLLRSGLEPGDRVATLCWNHHAHLECYFGAPMAGGVYHTLNLRLTPEELGWIAQDAGDRFLVVDDVLLPLYRSFAAAAGFERVFVVRLTEAPLEGDLEDYEELLAKGDGDLEPPPVDERQAAGLCYTSGTTGRPKGVVYSHRALVLHSLASALPDMLDLSQADVLLPVVPMFHANAWGMPFTATMVGCRQVFPGPHLDPVSLLDLYQAEGVTASAGVPTIWMGILHALEAEPDRWQLRPGMRMVVGGSAVPESMIRGFDALGMEVVQAWGMTETTPLGSVSRLKAGLAARGEDERYAYRARAGLSAPLVEVRAMSEAGEVPWDGQAVGELQVRGPWVARAYLHGRDPEKWTADGWFRTGDVVRICPEGYLEIVDRTKDLIKSGGEWISSVALENLLMAHPGVREAAVVAIPDEKWGERPLAVIVPREGEGPGDEELRAHLAPHFPRWALPDGFVRVSQIPRTSTGKFLKRQLRDELQGWKA